MKKVLCDIQEISGKNSRVMKYADRLTVTIEDKIKVIRSLSLIKRCIDNLKKKGFRMEVLQQIGQIVNEDVSAVSPKSSLNQSDNNDLRKAELKNSLSGARSLGQDSSTEKSRSRNELWNSHGSALLEDEYDLSADKVRSLSLVLYRKKLFDKTEDEEYIAAVFSNFTKPIRKVRSSLALLFKVESMQVNIRKPLSNTLDYSDTIHCLKSRKKQRNNSTISLVKEEKDSIIENNVSIGDFEVVKAISSGSHGKVCLVKKCSSGDYFAMKIIDKAAAIEKAQENSIRREVRIMRSIDSDYIAKLYYSFQNSRYLFFVMEYLNGGDLRNLLSLCDQIDEKVIIAY
jgi:hypothetical protein